MNTVIAGRFDAQDHAEQAIGALAAAGFPRDRIASFFVNPPGQHNRSGTHEDPDASAGAHEAASGAVAGALAGTGVGTVVGLATMIVLGPAAPLAGAAVGAYVGSFAGALDELRGSAPSTETAATVESANDDGAPRKSGMLVAVEAVSSTEQETAIVVLRGEGAAALETVEGSISHGEWTDFDPVGVPVLVRK